MNIIANDCVGGELYKAYDEQYKNPFIWNVIPMDDYIKLVCLYDYIDFSNVEYFETSNYAFPWYMSGLRIDNCVNIYYPHHMRLKGYPLLTKEVVKSTGQNGVFYEHMDDYLIKKYKERIERMTEKPIFVFSQENRNSKDDLKKLLKCAENRKMIFLTSDSELIDESRKNICYILKPQNEILQKVQAEYIKNNFDGFIKQE